MEYVIGLFTSREQAESSAARLREQGVDFTESAVKSRDNTVRAWLERLFDMQEPQAHMEPHGLHRNFSEWLDRQLDEGRTMAVFLVRGDAVKAQRALEGLGARDVCRAKWWPAKEPGVSDEASAASGLEHPPGTE